MLTLLTTMTAMGLAQLPAKLEIPAALEGARIEVTMQATSNHFAAENTSSVVQVLLLGCDDLRRAVRLSPGASVLYPFPRGTAKDLRVEVVSLEATGWRNTGSVSIARAQASDAGAVWVQAGADRNVLWVEGGDENLTHLVPGCDLIPEVWREIHPELQRFAVSRHVPVPLPTENKKGGKPPVIERKKLPPV